MREGEEESKLHFEIEKEFSRQMGKGALRAEETACLKAQKHERAYLRNCT